MAFQRPQVRKASRGVCCFLTRTGSLVFVVGESGVISCFDTFNKLVIEQLMTEGAALEKNVYQTKRILPEVTMGAYIKHGSEVK